MKDNPLKVCPTCKSRKIKRQISSGAGIIFKGSGFYQTDYRSSGYHSDVKADTAAKSASSSAPQADSSPTPKAESASTKTGTGKTPADK
jgi:predicted nucleic acid-binding Zn ribbon protein